MLVSMHLMLNVVSWSPCPFVHSEEQKHAPLLRTALRTLQLNPRSWSVAAGAFLSPCESEKAGKMGIFERVGPVVMVNTAQLWRLESGIDSGLVFVSGPTRPTERLFDSAAAPWQHWLFTLTHWLLHHLQPPQWNLTFVQSVHHNPCGGGEESNSYSLIFQPP